LFFEINGSNQIKMRSGGYQSNRLKSIVSPGRVICILVVHTSPHSLCKIGRVYIPYTYLSDIFSLAKTIAVWGNSQSTFSHMSAPGWQTLTRGWDIEPPISVVVNHRVKPKPLTCCGYAADFSVWQKNKAKKRENRGKSFHLGGFIKCALSWGAMSCLGFLLRFFSQCSRSLCEFIKLLTFVFL